ncbi:hypothetical protein DS832_02535 [Bombilactobacillus bombi]|uniref:Citrate transporter-like domain-containing protein n=2 Tax=Bombilactobacillus bombi TaxID=1303590 RepID=A0A3R6V7E5_9LACO|nr:hypothetical protein DS832_02535 [Bombilactobacillus bombi]
MGPMSREEKITAIVILVAIVFWILGSAIKLEAAITALIGVSVLVSAKVLTADDFKTKISWNTIIFIGTVMALGNVMKTVGLTTWLYKILQPVINPILSNIWITSYSFTNCYISLQICSSLSYIHRYFNYAVFITFLFNYKF